MLSGYFRYGVRMCPLCCPDTSVMGVRMLPKYAYCTYQDKRQHSKSLKKLQDAFGYITKKQKNNPIGKILGRDVNYYCLRHTYATNYVLRVMEARPDCTRDQLIEDHSLRRDLADQMGHEEIDTTFSHYVDNALVILAARKDGSSAYDFPAFEELIRLTHSKT